MSKTSRRIKALEKRVAVLEAESQAPQNIEAKAPAEAIAEAVIKQRFGVRGGYS